MSQLQTVADPETDREGGLKPKEYKVKNFTADLLSANCRPAGLPQCRAVVGDLAVWLCARTGDLGHLAGRCLQDSSAGDLANQP